MSLKTTTDSKEQFKIVFDIKENYLNFEGFNRDLEPFFSGFIKWDGCMEIHDLNYHFCHKDDVLQRIVDTIYVVGEKIMNVKF